MNSGYIYLDRKMTESWIYKKPLYFHWFVTMLYKANFKDNNKFEFDGEFVTVKRGEFVTSLSKLANELPDCSIQKLRTFIKLLKKSGTIQIKNIKKATWIIICNYDIYQGKQHDSNTTATRQQHDSNNNRIKEKESKEEKGNKNINNPEKSFSEDVNDIFKKTVLHFPEKFRPDTDKKVKDWKDCIDKLIRIDKHSKSDILAVVDHFRNNEPFWNDKFLTVKKLREKDPNKIKYMDRFLITVNSKSKKQPDKPRCTPSTRVAL